MLELSISQKISSHLPYLRRFGRVLTGSQAIGDSYVEKTLELLIEDPSSFRNDLEPRVALYKAFSQYWKSLDLNLEQDDGAIDVFTNVDKSLNRITPQARQAFLLATVEEFTTKEISEILDETESFVEALVDQAGHEIAEQVVTNVLIIEDEPIIAMDLEGLLQNLGHTVLGIARTHSEAVERGQIHRPGLILADIQLADDSSGIDAVNELLEFTQVPVIFITAFPERLLTGKGPEPAFLITKPFDPEIVKAVVSQALFFDKKSAPLQVE